MGSISLQIPATGQPNSTEDPKIASNFSVLQSLLNGNLDASNINLGAALAIPSGRAVGATQAVALGNYSINLGSTNHGTAVTTNGMSYSTATGFFTVPATGVYACTGFVNLLLNSATQTAFAYWILGVVVNNGGVGPGPAQGVQTTAVAPISGMAITDLQSCSIGDTLGLQVTGAGMSNTVQINNYAFCVSRIA